MKMKILKGLWDKLGKKNKKKKTTYINNTSMWEKGPNGEWIKKAAKNNAWDGYFAKDCHPNTAKVFSKENLTFYGGGSMAGVDSRGMNYLINVGSQLSPHVELSGIAMPSLSKMVAGTISIKWPDGSVPSLDREFWQSLLKDLKFVSKGKDFKVLVSCQGGHGRTGTALSILYGLCYPEIENPIQAVRDMYCKHVVETTTQVGYVGKILNKELLAAGTHVPSWSFEKDYANLLGDTAFADEDPRSTTVYNSIVCPECGSAHTENIGQAQLWCYPCNKVVELSDYNKTIDDLDLFYCPVCEHDVKTIEDSNGVLWCMECGAASSDPNKEKNDSAELKEEKV